MPNHNNSQLKERLDTGSGGCSLDYLVMVDGDLIQPSQKALSKRKVLHLAQI